jgi:hypothetical protein
MNDFSGSFKSPKSMAEFIRLRRQIEGLRPLKEKRDALIRDLRTHEAHRRKLLSEWEDVKVADYRAIQKAATKVSKKLQERVRVEVTMAGNREPLEKLLQEMVGGNLRAAIDRLKDRAQLSLPELAAKCREGRDSLIQHFGFAQGSADRIASANPELFMRIEELELAPTTKIELNTAPDGEPPSWHALEELSTGQKATAVLLLLLLESEAPLIVDQPEDDLDNRFITVAEIAEHEAHGERHIRLLAPLALLSPRIIAAIVNATAPTDLTVTGLAKALPYSWAEQERRIGLPS